MENKKPPRPLSAPFRAYWDIVPETDGGISPEVAGKTAAELASLKVFFVTLALSGESRGDLAGIISLLKKGGSRVMVSFGRPEAVPEVAVLELADGVDVRPEDEGLLEKLLLAVQDGKQATMTLTPERGGAEAAGRMIKAALDAGVRTFSLANPNVVYDLESAPRYALGAADRKAYADVLEGLLGTLDSGVRLFVHDLFLHRTLNLPCLGGRIEYAGCQAGDAIAYIDGSGTVYPCATFPVPLGELGKQTVKEIWASSERLKLREKIVSAPGECAGCGELPDCKGGCRGLACAVAGPEGKDPNCGG